MKKTLGLVLAVAMLCTMIMPMSISATVFTDTAATKYEKAVDVLSSIGIVEGRSEEAFEPDATLTRAEAATIILRLQGMEGKVAGKDIFTDVTSEHWAYANVAAAYGLGIINGMGDGTFAPDAVVTSAQAAKMLICALGYAVQADAQGGFPAGYVAKAGQLGIYDNVEAKTDGEITRGEFAIMVYNAIDVDVYEKTVYGDQAYEYEVKEDVTIISRDLKIFKIEGQVTAAANGYVSLPSKQLSDNEVVIGGRIYDKGETAASTLLARNVVAYADFTDDENPVLLYIAEANQGNILTLDAGDIVSTKTNKSEVVYEMENKEYTAKLTNAVMVKNGDYLGQTWSSSDIYPDCGTVTLVSNSGNTYAYVIVESYTDYVVQSVNADSKIVYFKNYGGKTQMEIDVNALDKKVEIIDADGNAVELKKLAEWTILSVLESSSRITAIVSKDTVNGVVLEESRKGILIGEKTFELAASLEKAPLAVTKPTVGKNATYYLDFMGKIAAVNRNAGSNHLYAYMKNIGVDGGSAFASDIKAEMFDLAASKMNIVDFTDRVVFVTSENIEKTIDKEDLLKETDIYKNGAGVPQLVRFERNENGAIKKLEVAQDFRCDFYGKDEEIRQQAFSLEFSTDGEAKMYKKGGIKTTSYFNSVGGNFIAGKYIISAQTKTLTIGKNYTAKDFTVTNSTTGWSRDLKSKFTTGYDANDGGLLAVIVKNNKELADYEAGLGGGDNVSYAQTKGKKPGVVVSITKGINEEEQTVSFLNLLTASGKLKIAVPDEFKINYGQLNCVIAKEEARVFNNPESKGLVVTRKGSTITRKLEESYIYIEDLAIGDVVKYDINSSNEAVMLNVLMKADNPGFVSFGLTETGFDQPSTTESYQMGIKDEYWYTGHDAVYCSVIDKATSDGRAVSTTYVPDSNAGYEKTNTSKVRKYSFPIPNTTIIVDLEANTVKTGSYLDAAPGDTICSCYGMGGTQDSNALTVIYKK